MSISMLYHYTSLEGLIGILKTQSIWASHCEFLNDSSEFHHALSFAKSYSGNLFMEDDYLSAFAWGVNHALAKMDRDDIYVSSFSENPDLLSQWRGYCPQGAGVCIGFDKKLIEQYCAEKDYKLSKCLYNHATQQKHISLLVSRCLKKFPEAIVSRTDYDNLGTEEQCEIEHKYQLYTSEGEGKPQADEALSQFCDSINECAPIMKDFGFHEEAEWRVVARNPTNDIHHRSANSHLVPYIQLSINKHNVSAVKKIIVGPNPNNKRCALSIASLLKTCNLESVEVELSAIPFSSW